MLKVLLSENRTDNSSLGAPLLTSKWWNNPDTKVIEFGVSMPIINTESDGFNGVVTSYIQNLHNMVGAIEYAKSIGANIVIDVSPLHYSDYDTVFDPLLSYAYSKTVVVVTSRQATLKYLSDVIDNIFVVNQDHSIEELEFSWMWRFLTGTLYVYDLPNWVI